MRDDSNEKPYVLFSAREVQPSTKPTEDQVEEEKGAWSFGPALNAATEEWSPCP